MLYANLRGGGEEVQGCGKGIWGQLDLQSTLATGLGQTAAPPTNAREGCPDGGHSVLGVESHHSSTNLSVAFHTY